MNQREKILVVIISIIGVLLIARYAKQGYQDKLKSLDKQISKLKKDIILTKAERKNAIKHAKEWMEIGEQTLSMEPNDVITWFRGELNELISQSGLSNAGSSSRNVDLSSKSDRYGKNGLRVLKGTVTAEGTLQQVLQFLFKAYRRPYLIRITNLELKHADTKNKGDRLKMIARVETLILPQNEMVKKINPVDLKKNKQKVVSDRLAFADFNDYYKTIKPELFKEFKPTPPPRPTPRPTVNRGPRPSPTPTPPPPPADSNLVLGRVLSSPRGQQVVLEDPRNKNIEDKRVEVGELLYGGTLIYVCPKGAVSDRDGQRRFHPLGIPLRDGRPLTMEEFPAVFDELSKLEKRSAGISKRPG